MGTKLKSFSRAWYMKAIAYFIIAATAAAVLWQIGNKADYRALENLGAASYENSNEVRWYFSDLASAVVSLPASSQESLQTAWEALEAYKRQAGAEDAVDVSGEPNDEETNTEVVLAIPIPDELIAAEVREEMRNYYNVWWNENGLCHLEVTFDGSGRLRYKSVYDVEGEQDLSYSHFVEEHPTLEEVVLESVLVRLEILHKQTKDALDNAVENQGFVYDLTDEMEISGPLAAKYQKLPFYAILVGNYVVETNVSQLEERTIGDLSGSGKVCYVGMSRDYYEQQKAQWDKDREEATDMMAIAIVGTVVILAAFFYLAIVTGRKPGEEAVCLYALDTVWSEVQWVIGGFCIAGILSILAEAVFSWDVIVDLYYKVAVGVLITLGMGLLSLVLSQIRLIKARKYGDSFLCVLILKKCLEVVKKAAKVTYLTWKRGKLSMRAMACAIVLPILCATWIGVPFVMAFLIYLIYKHMGDFLSICDGAGKIRGGQLRHQIVVKGQNGELARLAEDINEISQGLENAVSNELRSERLKAELISNVSHDLKTPLTSIVTYVDLLKQEGIENEVAKDYIEVIDRKAKRLTVLTNDLFEAAKASSGDMPVNIETVDLNALVRQALGEFDEKLAAADLNVRLTLPEAPSYIKADGKLTWRVIDNLLNNVVKYGQSGSRVYIEVKEMENAIRFVMKNISAYELNIPSDELMERFKRGDESRNSEGSGLGLSIANSLIDLQHGAFTLSIDGDLFKAEFELPRSQ